MGKQRKSFRTEFIERQGCIAIADRRLAEALRFATIAADRNSQASWKAAAARFRIAAKHYRAVGLGLLTKAQWLSCAECADALGDTEAAATCRREAEVIPTYWEGEK